MRLLHNGTIITQISKVNQYLGNLRWTKRNVRLIDSGDYACVVSNEIGQERRSANAIIKGIY